MAKFLANENVPASAVHAARLAGYDISWIAELSPGIDDEQVLAVSVAEGRVLVTFDKDFGHLAFRQGQQASSGILLLRPKLRSPDYLATFLVAVLAQAIDWESHFSVATEAGVRVVRLPG